MALGLSYSVSATVSADLSGEAHSEHTVKGYIEKGLKVNVIKEYAQNVYACGRTEVYATEYRYQAMGYIAGSKKCKKE